jgi:predicted ATPase
MPSRFILTGAPGAGKTALIRRLETLGHEVVEEAATDVIALAQAGGLERPWETPGFITDIAALQSWREAAPMRSDHRFADRSVFCTIALAEWLGYPVPAELQGTAEWLAASGWFERRVFLIAQLGFIENTQARRISLEEATRFGTVHEAVYERYGFELLRIPPASISERAAVVLAAAGQAAERTLRSRIRTRSACEKGLDSLGNSSLPPGGSSA